MSFNETMSFIEKRKKVWYGKGVVVIEIEP
jgi:hypothetical protein